MHSSPNYAGEEFKKKINRTSMEQSAYKMLDHSK